MKRFQVFFQVGYDATWVAQEKSLGKHYIDLSE